MKIYKVTLRKNHICDNVFVQADDEEHARRWAKFAHPDCTILYVCRAIKKTTKKAPPPWNFPPDSA